MSALQNIPSRVYPEGTVPESDINEVVKVYGRSDSRIYPYTHEAFRAFHRRSGKCETFECTNYKCFCAETNEYYSYCYNCMNSYAREFLCQQCNVHPCKFDKQTGKMNLCVNCLAQEQPNRYTKVPCEVCTKPQYSLTEHANAPIRCKRCSDRYSDIRCGCGQNFLMYDRAYNYATGRPERKVPEDQPEPIQPVCSDCHKKSRSLGTVPCHESSQPKRVPFHKKNHASRGVANHPTHQVPSFVPISPSSSSSNDNDDSLPEEVASYFEKVLTSTPNPHDTDEIPEDIAECFDREVEFLCSNLIHGLGRDDHESVTAFPDANGNLVEMRDTKVFCPADGILLVAA